VFWGKNMLSKKIVTFYKLTDQEIRNLEKNLESETASGLKEKIDKQAKQIMELQKTVDDLTYCLYEISNKLPKIEKDTKKRFWGYFIYDILLKIVLIVSMIILLASIGLFEYL